MIRYLDTSAIVKLLVIEQGTPELWSYLDGAPYTTSRISYAETRAALARRERESPKAAATWLAARAQLQTDWQTVQLVDVTQRLVERAAEFAEAFALRGFDAIQLASADGVRTASNGLDFVCFDRQLNRAARLLNLTLPPAAPV